jgi:SAM-dependent methyltransferase
MVGRGLTHLGLLALRGCRPLFSILRPLSKKRVQMDAGRWDREYASGNWKFLSRMPEEAHHLIVASYVNGLKRDARVLDVGCGEGVFNSVLRRFGYAHYLGIDISPVAVEAARVHTDSTTEFQVAGGATSERTSVSMRSSSMKLSTTSPIQCRPFRASLDR